MAVKKKGDQFLTYRGKPLVRSGNMIYYGNMNDPYVIMIQIMSKKMQGDIEVPDRVLIQLLNTDPDCRPKERIVKKSEKEITNVDILRRLSQLEKYIYDKDE